VGLLFQHLLTDSKIPFKIFCIELTDGRKKHSFREYYLKYSLKIVNYATMADLHH